MNRTIGLGASLLGLATLSACSGDPVDSAADAAADSHITAAATDLAAQLGAGLDATYDVVANRPGSCTAGPLTSGADGFCYEATITLTSDRAIEGRNWEIYFSQPDPLGQVAPGPLAIEHVNGDLHRITPTDSFEGFAAGEPVSVSFIVNGLVLSEAKLMPNWYATSGAGFAIIDSTRMETDAETGLPVRPWIREFSNAESHYRKGPGDATPLATSSFLFGANESVEAASDTVVSAGIIPTPVSVEAGSGVLDLAGGLALSLEGIDASAIAAPLERLAMLGVEAGDGVPVTVRVTGIGVAESYRLAIGEEITIEAADAAGAAYGLYSLAALVMPGETAVPQLVVEDAPRYGFRGMHIDVARNFHSLDAVLAIIDQMAAYKLNKLHLHLADDEGWRLEIPGLPELTDVGARRCYDPIENECLQTQLGSGPTGNAAVDGYFSVDDYKAILAAAKARHIEVIPSLDMPGHSRAAIKAMEARYRRLMAEGDGEAAREYLLTDFDDTTDYLSIQFYDDNTLNVCMDSTYHFIDKVVSEITAIHDEAGLPLQRYHIGADETAGAWTGSPACAPLLDADNGIDTAEDLGAYFIERVAGMVAEKGIIPAGWSDGLGHTDPAKMPALVQSNAWGVLPWGGAAAVHDQANLGWEVVLSTPDALYFDFPYEADPKEGGYYWAARRVNTRKVFELMPDNLPAMAELWKDPNEQPFTIDDTAPMSEGVSVIGIQGQVWSETLSSDDMLLYMVFPRLFALAERAWHEADWELAYDRTGASYGPETDHFSADMEAARDADWARFATIIAEKEMPKLDSAGVPYRVPTVGARIEDGVLEANTIFPGLAIEYREAGGAWRPYTGSTAVEGAVEIRARSGDGTRPGRSLPVTLEQDPEDGS